MKIPVLLLVSVLAMAQDRFTVKTQPFTNHNFHSIIKPFMPPAAKPIDGVLATVFDTDTAVDPPDAVAVTLRYRKNGVKFIRKQYAFLASTGCAPEPCRWAPVVFEIGGDYETDSVSATVEPVMWESTEELEVADSGQSIIRDGRNLGSTALRWIPQSEWLTGWQTVERGHPYILRPFSRIVQDGALDWGAVRDDNRIYFEGETYEVKRAK